jgi:type II secretory pathway pseudopilin PulG
MHTPKFSAKRAAFSLVEVALAIAVLSFAVIGILSLMAGGMGNYRKVMDTTIAAQIAQRLINDAEQASYKELTDISGQASSADVAKMEKEGKTFSFRAPRITSTGLSAFRFFDESGKEIVPKDATRLSPKESLNIVYWVNTRVTPRPRIPRADNKGTEVALLTIEIACNSNGLDLSQTQYIEKTNSSPQWNLLKAPAGIRVLTYSALIGRSE